MDNQKKVYTIEDVREVIEEGDIRKLCNILKTSNIDLNVNYEDNGDTPLIQAIKNFHAGYEDGNGKYVIIKLLLKFGADPNLGNSIDCRLPISRAENHRGLTLLLFEHGIIIREDTYTGPLRLLDAFENEDHELAIALLNAGAVKESIYGTDPILDDQIDVGEVDKFFEECELCDEVFSSSKRIKGVKK